MLSYVCLYIKVLPPCQNSNLSVKDNKDILILLFSLKNHQKQFYKIKNGSKVHLHSNNRSKYMKFQTTGHEQWATNCYVLWNLAQNVKSHWELCLIFREIKQDREFSQYANDLGLKGQCKNSPMDNMRSRNIGGPKKCEVSLLSLILLHSMRA